MNNYGLIVNEIGLEPFITAAQQALLQPIGQLLYPGQAGARMDMHHSFMVQYKPGEDLGCSLHIGGTGNMMLPVPLLLMWIASGRRKRVSPTG